MKRKFKVMTISLFLGCSVLFSSCVGSFGLFNKLLAWNQSVSDKFVNELVFLILTPVYGVVYVVDAFILNTIEFWTDENPVADTKIQKIDGKDGIYTVETNKDGHKITKEGTDETVYFHFNEAEKSWSIEANEVETLLMKAIDDQHVIMYLPDGSEMPVSLDKAGVLAFKQVVMEKSYFASR